MKFYSVYKSGVCYRPSPHALRNHRVNRKAEVDKMTVCTACERTLKSPEKIICSRSSCGKAYHYLCVNLTPSNTKKQHKWICPECTAKSPKNDNSNTPVRSHESSNIPNVCPNTEERCNVTVRKIISPADNSDSTSTQNILEVIRTELPMIIKNLLNTELKPIKDQITSLESSIQFMNTQYEDLRKQLSENSSEIKSLRDKVLQHDLDSLELKINKICIDMARQQQWARLQNIELVGIPESKEEITEDIVVKIASHIGVSIVPTDIEFAHRVQPRRPSASNTKVRTIVVRFKQRSTKDIIVAAARRHKGLSSKMVGLNGDTKIYINEHLTKENKSLLKSCKIKAKEINYKYVWTKNCTIYVRKNEVSPSIPIMCEGDLNKIT